MAEKRQNFCKHWPIPPKIGTTRDDTLNFEVCDLVKNLQAENSRLNDALVKIRNWAQAYPLDIFPQPDLKKAHKVLKAAGMTLDAISADAMRHVLSGVTDIVEQALKGE